jgi:hypothetical protein
MKRRPLPAPPKDKTLLKRYRERQAAASRFARYMTEDGFTALDWLRYRPLLDSRIDCTLKEVKRWTLNELADAHIVLNNLDAAGL